MSESAKHRVTADLEASRDVVSRALSDGGCIQAIADAAELVVNALRAGRKILFAGNGGSAADAQHLATELVVRFKATRRALPAIALTTDSSMLTAIGNDLGFEHLFSRQIEALGQPGDVFFGISTSGRSPNILAACRVAQERKIKVVGLTGAGGGAMASCCDILVSVPSNDTALIQQVHIAVGHSICAIAEEGVASGATR